MTPYDILPSIYRQLRAVGVDTRYVADACAFAPIVCDDDAVLASFRRSSAPLTRWSRVGLSFYAPLTRDNAVDTLRGIIGLTDADEAQTAIVIRSLLQVVASQWDGDEASDAITAWRSELGDE